MYPECRYVRPSGGTCDSPSLKGSHWCYYHGSLQQRKTIRHSQRRADGRFIALPPPQPEGNAIGTLDYGSYPVTDARVPHPERSEGWDKTEAGPWQNTSLDLPLLEDAVSIQLALIDVAQALAANRIDAKRAGLLLYALQVASANVQKMHIPISDAVRTVTYTEEGAPLAPQDYGYDIEDYEDDEDEDEEE
jgi:hypothetical protein